MRDLLDNLQHRDRNESGVNYHMHINETVTGQAIYESEPLG